MLSLCQQNALQAWEMDQPLCLACPDMKYEKRLTFFHVFMVKHVFIRKHIKLIISTTHNFPIVQLVFENWWEFDGYHGIHLRKV